MRQMRRRAFFKALVAAPVAAAAATAEPEALAYGGMTGGARISGKIAAIMRADPHYLARALAATHHNPELRRAWLAGEWQS